MDIFRWSNELCTFFNNKPLNGVEFQNAIINNREQLELRDLNKKADKEQVEDYIKWVGKYLFYFDTSFDNREGEINEIIKYKGKSKLMLIPIGAKTPMVFQRKHKMDYLFYTHNLKDFYKAPKIIQ